MHWDSASILLMCIAFYEHSTRINACLNGIFDQTFTFIAELEFRKSMCTSYCLRPQNLAKVFCVVLRVFIFCATLLFRMQKRRSYVGEPASNVAAFRELALKIIYIIIGVVGITGNSFVIIIFVGFTNLRQKVSCVGLVSDSKILHRWISDYAHSYTDKRNSKVPGLTIAKSENSYPDIISAYTVGGGETPERVPWRMPIRPTSQPC